MINWKPHTMFYVRANKKGYTPYITRYILYTLAENGIIALPQIDKYNYNN